MNNFVKIVLLGESGVGKTAILDRFVNKRFTGSFKSTIGADFLTQEMEVDKKLVTLQIWDTAGQERFHSLSKIFYRGADCCILVFDITVPKTLQELSFWRQEFSLNAEVHDTDFPIFVLGNRCDMDAQRKISTEDAMSWCKSHGGVKYIETSAKSGANVEKAFRMAVQDVLSRVARERTERVLPPQAELNIKSVPETRPKEEGESCC